MTVRSNKCFYHSPMIDWLSTNAKKTFGKGKRSKSDTYTCTPPYTLEEFLEGRSNFESYAVFYTTFIPTIGRKTFWREQVLSAKDDKDVATRSNEAFALLVLENHWERWLDIFCLNKGMVTSTRGQKRCVSESNILPKYTRGGISFKDEKMKVKEGVKGWSSKGILRFNELYKFVSKDRKQHPDFIQQWLALEKENLSGKKKRKKKDVESVPVAKHELFSDTDESVPPTPEKRQGQAVAMPIFTSKEKEQDDSVTDLKHLILR